MHSERKIMIMGTIAPTTRIRRKWDSQSEGESMRLDILEEQPRRQGSNANDEGR